MQKTKAQSYVFNLFLQQIDDLPLTVQHLNVEVDDDAVGKKKKQETKPISMGLVWRG